jgi:hypothetical protein
MTYVHRIIKCADCADGINTCPQCRPGGYKLSMYHGEGSIRCRVCAGAGAINCAKCDGTSYIMVKVLSMYNDVLTDVTDVTDIHTDSNHKYKQLDIDEAGCAQNRCLPRCKCHIL